MSLRDRFRLNERVIAVSISTALVMAGQGIIGPVLPVFARQLGVGATAAGVAVGAFAFARLLFNVPLGALSDTRGRRLLLVGGPLVVSVGMLGSGWAGTIETLVAWRFVAGLGSSMYMTGAMAYLADIATPSNRARLLGVNQAALLFGTSIGPSIGGLLAERFGLRAPFFTVAVATSVAAIYGWIRMPETVRRRERDPGETFRSRRAAGLQALRAAPFLAIAFVNFAIFLTRGTARQTLIPLSGVDRFGLSLEEIGLLLGAMALLNMVLLPPVSSAADRWGRVRLIVPGSVIAGAGLFVLGFADGAGLFVAGGLLLGLATSVTGPAPAAYVADITSDTDRGLTMGTFRTAGDLGLMIGPPLLGMAADRGGYDLAFGINAALMIVAAGVLALVAGRRRSVAR